MRVLFHAVIAGSVVLATSRSAQCVAPVKPAIGTTVKDFTAKDVLGATLSLSQVDRDKIVVFAFLGVDCPLAKLYTPRVVELANKYQPKGVVFFGVDANRQDAVTQIAAFARRHQIDFRILKDLRQTLADRVGATRTPEVIVLDRERRIRYRGRIDDQVGFVPTNRAASYHKTRPERNDLQLALDELLTGDSISVPETDAAGCLIGRDRAPAAHSAVTYSKDVAPILNKRCVVCHRPKQIAPFALTSYEEAVGWADMISEVTELNRMPPWHADPKYGSFRNDSHLTDNEKHIFAEWAAAGAPQGDPKDLPPPPQFADGWMIPEPDEIIYMSSRLYDVPATGIVPYKYFVVDPGWKEDRWISAIEARPGNPSVVHHILVAAIPPGAEKREVLREDDAYLGTYVPGFLHEALGPGFARPVPAGSKLVFNVHYTPNGTPQEDRSYVGIKFADPKSVIREVTVSCAFNHQFRIPPGASNYEVRSQYAFKCDSLLLAFGPHMHYRGKDFLYEALYPNGHREILLSVPRYDFGWQPMYRLQEPKMVPRGTVITCVAHFDNSEANLNNPDPKVAVTWGQQTFDEMMAGFFEIAPAAEGLLHRTRWWTPIVSRWTLVGSRLSAGDLAGIMLTIVNVFVIGAITVGLLRSRKRTAVQKPSMPPTPVFPESSP